MIGDSNFGFIAPKTITTMRSPAESLGLGILAICINVALMGTHYFTKATLPSTIAEAPSSFAILRLA